MPWNYCFKSSIFFIKYTVFFNLLLTRGGLTFSSTQQLQKGFFPLLISPRLLSQMIKFCGIPTEYAALSEAGGRIHTDWCLTNFRLYKKARTPIFPVLNCVISDLSGFLTLLCNCKTLMRGVGTRTRSSFPFDSAAQDSAH